MTIYRKLNPLSVKRGCFGQEALEKETFKSCHVLLGGVRLLSSEEMVLHLNQFEFSLPKDALSQATVGRNDPSSSGEDFKKSSIFSIF